MTTPEADRLSQIKAKVDNQRRWMVLNHDDAGYLLSLVEQLQRDLDFERESNDVYAERMKKITLERDYFEDAHDVALEHAQELRATSARLRTALESIAAHNYARFEMTDEDVMERKLQPHEIAEAALAGDPTPAGGEPDPRLREALQRIADWSDCQCEHDDDNCCARADTDFHCPGCIAAAALGEPDGRRVPQLQDQKER
jgi:hypothetical protein